MNRDRDAAPSTLRDALTQFADREVKLSKDISAAVSTLDRIEAGAPSEPRPGALEEAVLAGADDDEIDTLILGELGFMLRRNAYSQARLTAAQRALATIRADAVSIHGQLRKQADAIITRLTQVAEIGDVTLDQLIRTNRQDEAKLLAGKDIDVAELNALHNLRQLIWEGEAFGISPVECGWWKDPVAADHHAHGTGAAYIISAIRGGGVTWYPTPNEATAAAQPIALQMQVLAAQEKQVIVNRFGTA